MPFFSSYISSSTKMKITNEDEDMTQLVTEIANDIRG
jgi:hypothetical protein